MYRILTVLLLMVLTVAGCSSNQTPVTPSGDERPAKPGSLDTIPIIEGTSYSDGTFQATGVLGAYELTIDPETMNADLVSKRFSTALGASWTVSGIAFFTIAPCSDCLTLKSFSFNASDKVLRLGFTIRHPFDKGNPGEPPTAKNRLDLDIFDLAAVIVPIGSTPATYPLSAVDAYPGVLVNNAGYTTELANVIGDDAAMPYVLVVDDNAAGTNTWNEFSMGTQSFFDVFFDFSSPRNLAFEMYLTMGYGASAQGKNQRLNPTYFNPEFNRKAAWKAVVSPPEGSELPSTLNTWNDQDSTTPFDVTVKVFDWQQGVTSIVNPPVKSGDIAYASNVSLVSIEIPGMNNKLQSISQPASGIGAPNDPLIYHLSIANEKLLPPGEYVGLVKVTDERTPQPMPPNEPIDYLINAEKDGSLTDHRIPELAIYQVFRATVVSAINPAGFIWGAGFGSAGGNDQAVSAGTDSSGNVYIAGITDSVLYGPNAGGFDMFVCKYSSSGFFQWGRQFGTSDDSDILMDMEVDSSGNCYIAGSIGVDFMLRKYDSNGTFQWETMLGMLECNAFGGVAIDSLGNVYFAGTTAGSPYNPNAGLTDIFLAKYNTNGFFQWGRNWGTTESELTHGCAADSGYVYVVGYTMGSLYATSQGSMDVFISKYSSSNVLAWGAQFGTPFDDIATNVTTSSSHDVYTVGVSWGSLFAPNIGSSDLFLSKYNSSGAFQWGRSLGTTGYDWPMSVSVDTSGYIDIAGWSQGSLYSTNQGGEDIFFSRYNPSGTSLLGRSYGGTSNDLGMGIASWNSRYFYIVGYSHSTTFDMDPESGVATWTNSGYDDSFVSKFYY